MNHRNLKIIIAACWTLAAIVLLSSFILYSKPYQDEKQACLAAVAAYDDLAKLEARSAARHAYVFAKDEQARLEALKTEQLLHENDSEDLGVAIQIKRDECDRQKNNANFFIDRRVAARHRLHPLSFSILGVSFAFLLLLFTPRDPATRPAP